MLVYLQNDLISRWFKQRINYIEKANKEHYQRNSESIKPLRRKMIHCFEALQSDRESFDWEQTSKHVSRIICFRAGLQSAFRESFDSERDFKARFANHLIQSGTSKRVSRIILFQSRTSKRVSRIIWFRAGLQSTFRESFVSERDFKARFANHLIQSGTSKRVSRIILFQSRTSKRVSRIIWFRAGLQSTFRESFDSERDFKARFANHFISEPDFKARFANHLIQSGTSKRVSRIICSLSVSHVRRNVRVTD